MKFLTDLVPTALAVAAALVALSTPAAAQEPTDPSALPSAQPAGPGPEVIAAHQAVLIKTIADLQAGKPDYDSMVPGLADAVRAQESAILLKLKEFGAVKSIIFAGSQQQALKFNVAFENGETTWFIVMTPEGKIAGLVFRDATPPPA